MEEVKMANPPQKEIPNEMNTLEKEISALLESLEDLAVNLVSVTSQENTEVAKDEEVKPNNCELSEFISVQSSRVLSARVRIQSLTNRVQL